AGGGAPEERPAELNPKSRLPSDSALELLTAGADQVMTDVRFSGIGRPFGDLPGSLDALQRHAHRALAGRFGEGFDGVAVAVAAGKIHPPVHPDRIALKDLFDHTDAFEELV